VSARSRSRRDFLLGAAAAGAGLALASRTTAGDWTPAAAAALSPLKPLGPSPPKIGAAERAERRAALSRHLRDRGYAALVAGPGVHLEYLTGVGWGLSERLFVAILKPDAAPRFVCPAFERPTAAEKLESGWSTETWEEHEDPHALAARVIDPPRGGRVAADPYLRFHPAQRLGEALTSRAARLDDGVELMRELRIVKSEAELALIRHANHITKAALRAAAAAVEPGMRQSQLAELVREAQIRLGGAQPWALVLFGPNAAFPHGTEQDRALEPGDGILVDCGCGFEGYRSDVTRTWALGRPKGPLRRAWDAVRAAQQRAFEALRPGLECEAADRAARQVIEQSGFGTGYQRFTHRLGHGIGMEGHEDPYLVRGNRLPLRAGMTMSDEPGVYLPGELGVRLEDIVAITAEGAEYYGEVPTSLEQPFGP